MFSLDLAGDKFEHHRYNSLGSIEAANAVVRADNQIDAYLAHAAQLFVRHGVHQRFGVALLHQHSECEPGERMIQYDRVIDGQKALLTYPVVKADTPGDELPSVWAWSGDGFVPLEFTTDTLARELLLEGDIPTTFLEEFADLTMTSPIGHLMGLAVVERSLYREAADGQTALEYSTTARENVMMLGINQPAKYVQTSWAFYEVVDDVGEGLFAKTNTNCVTGCKTYCEAYDSSGGHEKNRHKQHHWPPGTIAPPP